MSERPSYELEEALTTAAAGGYRIAVEHGVQEISPRDTLEVALSMRRTGRPYGSSNLLEILMADENGRKKIEQLAEMVVEKVAALQNVDPKE